MNINRIIISVAFLTLAGSGVSTVDGQTFAIPWYTIDAGGRYAAGGNFELHGTIGQYDAGPTMGGSSFVLTGGFWAGVSQVTILLGDVNQDGVVDLLDVAPFVDALVMGNYIPQADINQDGVVDLLDVALFVELLGG